MPLNNYGQAQGYDQFAPGRDVPNQSRPQRSPLQSAITGAAPQPQLAPTQYPTDSSMTAWRTRQPGQQPKIQPVAPPQAFDPGGSLQATTAPTSYQAGPVDAHIQQDVANFISQNGLQANQNDPAALFEIVKHLRGEGQNAQVDYTDSNHHTGGILLNGQPLQMIDGSNRFTQLQPWEQSAQGAQAQGKISPLFSALVGGSNNSDIHTLIQQLLAQSQGASPRV